VPPRLTIAIPLHQAAQWVENVASVGEKAPEWSEVVLSDATHEDDALERLEERFGAEGGVAGNERGATVIFRRRAERLDWREHCNLLLEESEAEYFCWMPQDDAVGPDEYFDLLVGALEEDREAVLAFAPSIVPVRRGRGSPLRVRRNFYLPVPRSDLPRRGSRLISVEPPRTLGDAVPEEDALWLLENWPIAITWRGVVRRSRARPIPADDSSDHTDSLWSFSTALAGKLVLVEEASYFKRYYRGSAHQGFSPWRPQDQSTLYRAEVEARLGAGTERAEWVWQHLEGFFRRRERGEVRRALGKIRNWLVDEPRIAVERT
jgi:hypothetical protein